jgi:hypothetical protein
MKLSKKSRLFLSNMAAVASSGDTRHASTAGIKIRPGRIQSATNIAKNTLVLVKFDEEFPCEHAIYHVGLFLSSVNLIGDSADLAFTDKMVTISGESANGAKQKITLAAAGDSLLVVPNVDSLPEHNVVGRFALSSDTIETLIKAAGILGAEELTFDFGGQDITVSAHPERNSGGSSYQVCLKNHHVSSAQGGEGGDGSISAILRLGSLNLFAGSYTVTACVAKNRGSYFHFVHDSEPIQYWIAVVAQ